MMAHVTHSLRSAAIGFVGTLAAFAGIGWAGAQGIAGFNSNAPVDYNAGRIELQDRQDRVVLSGDVVVTQGDLRLDAARMTVAYVNTGALQIQRIDATGGVTVKRGGETAMGNVGIYDFNRRIITLAGDVRLRRGGDTLNGGRLVIDLNTGISSVDGSSGAASPAAGTGSGVSVPARSGGRVSGSFTVPKN